MSKPPGISTELADAMAATDAAVARAFAVLDELEALDVDKAAEFARTIERVIAEGFAGLDCDLVIARARLRAASSTWR